MGSRDRGGLDPRVRYQRTNGRAGLAGNWNSIVDTASGTFTTIIGDDDRLLPTFIDKLLAARRGADVIFSNHFLIDANGPRLIAATAAATAAYGRRDLRSGVLPDAAKIVWTNTVPMSASLIRTSWLRKLRFREDLNTPELEFFARLVAEGGCFSFCSDHLAEYRVHGAQETARGLTFARLAYYLEKIPTEPQFHRAKKDRIESLMLGAVSTAITQDDIDGARELVRADLYPRSRLGSPRVLGQLVSTSLPGELGVGLYRVLSSINRRVLSFCRRVRNYRA